MDLTYAYYLSYSLLPKANLPYSCLLCLQCSYITYIYGHNHIKSMYLQHSDPMMHTLYISFHSCNFHALTPHIISLLFHLEPHMYLSLVHFIRSIHSFYPSQQNSPQGLLPQLMSDSFQEVSLTSSFLSLHGASTTMTLESIISHLNLFAVNLELTYLQSRIFSNYSSFIKIPTHPLA